MPNFVIRKATKKQIKLRMALAGPAGAGKTYSALKMATLISQILGLPGKIALIDTEAGSSEKYADQFTFDVLVLEPPYQPANYTAAIKFCEAQGYDFIITDSLSHAWQGPGGALEMVDSYAATHKGDKWGAWRDVTPQHHELVETILRCRAHFIGTMRSKMETEKVQENGKAKIVKLGMQPMQRDGMEYEFDVFMDVDYEHQAIASKTRCPKLDGMFFKPLGEKAAEIIAAWLQEGEPEDAPDQVVAATEVKATAPAARATGTNSNPELPAEKSQRALVAWAKSAYNMDGASIGQALKVAGMSSVDLDRWDEMVAAIKKAAAEKIEPQPAG